MKYVSVFSGIEAASVAFIPLGWDPVCFSEIDVFASAVLKYRYPEVPNAGDITKINWKEVVRKYGRPDVIVGGSPCQSFSIAGGRDSLDGESRLMFEYIRAAEELLPRWVLWENVPGVLSTKDDAFGQLLDSLQDLGYVDLAWRVLDAQFFGVAQRRRRVFLVGHLGKGGSSAAVLFEPESVSGNTQTSREKRKELAGAAGIGASCSGFKWHQGADAGGIGCEAEQSPTLTADWHNPAVLAFAQAGEKPASHMVKTRCGKPGGGKGALVGEELSFTLSTGQDQTLVQADSHIVRRLTPVECERLQGFPDGWTDVPYRGAEHPSDGPRYRALGNSMAVPVMRWIGERMEIVDGILKDQSERKAVS